MFRASLAHRVNRNRAISFLRFIRNLASKLFRMPSGSAAVSSLFVVRASGRHWRHFVMFSLLRRTVDCAYLRAEP